MSPDACNNAGRRGNARLQAAAPLPRIRGIHAAPSTAPAWASRRVDVLTFDVSTYRARCFGLFSFFSACLGFPGRERKRPVWPDESPVARAPGSDAAGRARARAATSRFLRRWRGRVVGGGRYPRAALGLPVAMIFAPLRGEGAIGGLALVTALRFVVTAGGGCVLVPARGLVRVVA